MHHHRNCHRNRHRHGNHTRHRNRHRNRNPNRHRMRKGKASVASAHKAVMERPAGATLTSKHMMKDTVAVAASRKATQKNVLPG